MAALSKFSLPASQQQTAPFLRLPAELRNRIYELVFCNKKIHIDIRPAYLRDKHVSKDTECYRICKEGGIVDNAFWDCHRDCELIQESLRGNTYKFQEEGYRYEKYKEALAEYGRPLEGGLRKAYPESRLDLGVLQTCQQTYSETKLLPYALNVFDCYSLTVSKPVKVLQSLLQVHQREAIRSVYVNDEVQPSDLQELRDVFPSLKTMRWDVNLRSIKQLDGVKRKIQQTTRSRPVVVDPRIVVCILKKELGAADEHRMAEKAAADEIEKILADPLLRVG